MVKPQVTETQGVPALVWVSFSQLTGEPQPQSLTHILTLAVFIITLCQFMAFSHKGYHHTHLLLTAWHFYRHLTETRGLNTGIG